MSPREPLPAEGPGGGSRWHRLANRAAATRRRFRLARAARTLTLLTAAFLGACAHRPLPPSEPGQPPAPSGEVIPREGPAPRHEQDRGPKPHQVPEGLERIPDPVVKAEPKSRYGNPESYKVRGKRYYVLPSARGYRERGDASWYGKKFHGRRTSSGETYDMYAMTAAHRTLPLPTFVRVTNLRNGRSVVVRVNDRGPFHDQRIIDLSYAAALKLDLIEDGHAPVEVVALEPGDPEQKPWLTVGEPVTDPVTAIALREELVGAGIENVSIRQHSERSDGLHTVQIGPLRDTEEAESLRAWLAERGWRARLLTP